MSPRARYVFGGDMRISHAYGGQNPCAIELAPVGRAADWDLNLPDTAAALYTQNSHYFQIVADTLTLIQTDGATVLQTLTLSSGTYPTLQDVVDRINATSVGIDGQQWRAQLCPGVNPAAPTASAMCGTNRVFASCAVVSGSTTISRSAGGLNSIAVGMYVSNANVPAGTYIVSYNTDTTLTMSAAATGTNANTSITFFFRLGDDPTAATTDAGYQRVISGSLPGFVYFAKAYLDSYYPIDKSAIWMTRAAPGAVKSAANSFTTAFANIFKPPLDAGISQGGASVDQGFVVPFANMAGVIRNVRDQGSGIDADYRLRMLNHTRGCIAWNTVVPGARFVPYLTRDGVVAADLDREILLSEAIFRHAPDPFGDFTYEVPLASAAAAADDDGGTVQAYAAAKIMRSALWLSYRSAALPSPTRPDRMLCYDFSSGTATSGLEALVREDGSPWGWSTALERAVTAMCEGRKSDGPHLYGWNEANSGSTGDGRIDEIEVGETDNGIAIAAEVLGPWEKAPLNSRYACQELSCEHFSPTDSVGSLDFHRSYYDEIYPLTLSDGDGVDVMRDLKLLSQQARVVTVAFRLGFSQTSGRARELRRWEARTKIPPTYRPAFAADVGSYIIIGGVVMPIYS